MTLTAGSYLYVFDGQDWTELSFTLDIDQLVERIPLDFVPG